jgi:hypothetical protein
MGLLRGIGIVVFIVALAGVIAYIGDRVGHQVGRKRLTLFNIRPRYTSTMIAVATGMIIALIVTLVAIFASNQVQTAFFRLAEINTEIETAQARARELERKVNSSPVVVNLDQLMVPSVGRIPPNYPPALRRQIVDQFYNQTVSYVNRFYTRPGYGLKKFVAPANLDKMLDSLANGPQTQAFNAQNAVLLVAAADQNLYPGDQIHFQIIARPDVMLVPSGQPIASLVIPAGHNVSADLAMAELLGSYVPREMLRRGMLPYFAGNVLPGKMLPDVTQMRSMLTGGGSYIMTAFAASDIYQHTFSVPVVVTLQKAPPQ